MARHASRAKRLAVIGVAATLLVVGAASIGGAPGAGAQADHVVAVSAHIGTPDTRITVSGTGCASGIASAYWDGDQAPGSFLAQTKPDGTWSSTVALPSGIGVHTLTAVCSDQSTAGAPTTMLGPGLERFTYQPVELETREAVPLTSATTQTTSPAPTPAPVATWQPTPAAALPGAADDTG